MAEHVTLILSSVQVETLRDALGLYRMTNAHRAVDDWKADGEARALLAKLPEASETPAPVKRRNA